MHKDSRTGSPIDTDFVRAEGRYTFVALRHEDIQALRKFRNAQMDVLRQKAPISEQAQEEWYASTVVPTHVSSAPAFLLVSILEQEHGFIGYGGLTNIDWDHLRGELSFLVSPQRAGQAEIYEQDFRAFLKFVLQWSFETLGLNRLVTETYAFRHAHIAVMESEGMVREGTLKQHTTHPHEPGYVDSILHGVARSDWPTTG